MEYPVYSEYKVTDHKLTKQIPSHWEIRKLKFMASIQNGKDYKHIEVSDGYDVIGSGGIFAKASNYLYEGESVLLGRKGTIDVPLFVNDRFWTVDTMFYTIIHEETIAKYLYYCSVVMPFKYLATQTALPSITQFDLENFYLSYPAKPEQQKIADFLDYKTQQIDQLIKKKKSLIEKLNEQRIAVITQAVTKGIDKNAKMKPSGVDWLGDVPEHWTLIKSRFLFNFGRGLGITKANLQDDGIPCINYGEIHSKYGFEIIPEKHTLKCVNKTYLENQPFALLKNGDFIFADTSEDIEGSGNFSYLNSNTPTFAGYHTVVAKLVTQDSPRFLAYLFDSLLYRYQIRKNVSGVKVFSITHSILKSSHIWLPPLTEQKLITTHLDAQLHKIDSMTAASKKTIKYYKEYRSALITSAVTGKIDIRNVKLPNQEFS